MTVQKILLSAFILTILGISSCVKDDSAPIAPKIISTSPLQNAKDVAIKPNIIFTFSEEMDPSSINSSTITLKKDALKIDGEITYSDRKATFKPSLELALNTVYHCTVSVGAKSQLGVALENAFILNFTTIQMLDDVVPTISTTDPKSNEKDVSRNKKVSIIFSEPMDASTINNNTISVKKGASSEQGVITYTDHTATFTSKENFLANTEYTVAISSDAKDVAGNALANNISWIFTTGGSSSAIAAVELGGAGNYVILAKTAINNSAISVITGQLGLSPAATSYITGLALVDFTGYATSSQVVGKVYAADMAPPTPIILTTAVNNMITAYNDAAGRLLPDFLELATGNIGSLTLEAGLYKWTSNVSIAKTITLKGGANDVWIFQIAGNLTQGAGVSIILNGGAQAKNIFWQVAGEAKLGSTSHFEGNILSMTGITFLTNASMNGRALAQTAVILDANTITQL